MNDIYLVTDTHFGHKKLIELKEITQEQIDKCWLSLKQLETTDLLIHLGDVAFGDRLTISHSLLGELKCKKILIQGNHDDKSMFWYLAWGWDMACDSLTIRKYGYNIIFTHVPKRHVTEGSINICGHMHYKELHITNKISLPPLQLFKLELLIDLYKKRRFNVSLKGASQ